MKPKKNTVPVSGKTGFAIPSSKPSRYGLAVACGDCVELSRRRLPLGDISNNLGGHNNRTAGLLQKKVDVHQGGIVPYSSEESNAAQANNENDTNRGSKKKSDRTDDVVGSVCRTFFKDDVPLQQILNVIHNSNKGSKRNPKRKYNAEEDEFNLDSPDLMVPPSRVCVTNEDIGPQIKQSKSKSSKAFPELNKLLFGERENVPDCEQVENSRIHGYCDMDDGLVSDDDCDYDAHYDDFEGRYDRNSRRGCPVPEEYASLGPPNVKCLNCEAIMWKEERFNKYVVRGIPKFNLCCGNGKIRLPKAVSTPSYLWQLYNDPKKGPSFHRCSRIYNSMFAFTSTGGSVDNSINNGGGPYVYRLNGVNHHLFGSLIPNDRKQPKFCQLYIYDTQNEVSNRLKWVDVTESKTICEETVQGLMKMLDETK